MFLTIEQIKVALNILEEYHIFLGTDFLVFKQANVPIGSMIIIPIDAESKKFMDEYYKPQKSSTFYYRPMRSTQKEHRWLRNDFPGSGAQSTRTRGQIANALLHKQDTQLWGWDNNYVQILKTALKIRKKLPILALAVWLYRERDFDEIITKIDLINKFIDEFQITDEEKVTLFSVDVPVDAQGKQLLQDKRITWEELEEIIGPPPDSKPGEGGTLTYLTLIEVGPVGELEFAPAERLNLITGDNGLGKTFRNRSGAPALAGG